MSELKNKANYMTIQSDKQNRAKINTVKCSALFCAVLLISYSLFSAFTLSACTPASTPVTKSSFFFNTYITITFYSETDAAYFPQCEAMCRKYESLLSRTVEGSDIYKINHANGESVIVSDETAALINDALSFSELTDGAVDITVAPLMDLWDFTSDKTDKIPPSDSEITEALKHVDYKNLSVNGNEITLSDPNASIDLGFIAKGYIADKLKEYLVSQGVKSALINLGGNIQLIGCKPDGDDYIIGVKKPFTTTDETLTSLPLRDTSFVTSGIYERCYEYDGSFYHHILNPKTGYPVNSGLNQVSVLCNNSETADALSTTLMLLGKKEGMDFLSNHDFKAHAIFVDSSNTMTYSQDFPE